MDLKPEIDGPTHRPSRRDALRRLAGAVVAAYVVPEVLFLSEARAGNSKPSSPSIPTPSVPSPSTSAPSSVEDDDDGDKTVDIGASGAAEAARDTCNIHGAQSPDTISISRSDLSRSQDAIEAGYAKPLDQIWTEFVGEYDGKVIGVEFLDRQSNPRYRFRAISNTGRLETVTISAQTGIIQRIVGC